MTCNICGHDRFYETAVSDTFRVDDRLFLVEGIPAEVCERCGEPNFSLAVAEHLRRICRASRTLGC
jgi:YgiT-type zinc finger domain-containing protein